MQESYLDIFPGKRLRVWKDKDEKYDPAALAVLTLTQLRTIIDKAIVDIHNRGKDDASGEIRIERWKKGVAKHRPRQPRHAEDLVELVGCYERRVASNDGIKIFGLRYVSDDLSRYIAGFSDNPEVEVRYTPDDIEYIWVVDNKQQLSFKVRAKRYNYARGMSLHRHRVIRQHAVDRGASGRIHFKELEVAKAELHMLGQQIMNNPRQKKVVKNFARYFGPNPDWVEETQQRAFNAERSRRTYGAEDGDEEFFDIDLGDEDHTGWQAVPSPPELPPIGAATSSPAETAHQAPIVDDAEIVPAQVGREESDERQRALSGRMPTHPSPDRAPADRRDSTGRVGAGPLTGEDVVGVVTPRGLRMDADASATKSETPSKATMDRP